MKWQVNNGVIFSQLPIKNSKQIAAFNLYGTIITSNWDFMFSNTREKLKNLYDDGYVITLFINRPNLIKKEKHVDFIEKVEELQRRLSIPIEVYIATEDNYYMKPMTGMWELCGRKNGFVCSDCAGRIYSRRDKDYNNIDYLFALNTKLIFYTPEELFDKPHRKYQKKMIYMPPKLISEPFPWESLKKVVKNKPNIIITVGCPSIWKRYIVNEITIQCTKQNYYVINSITELNDAMEENRNIILDNKNPTREHIYKELKQKYNKIILYFDFPKDLALHLNHYRTQKYNEKKQSIWIYDKYYDNLVKPTIDEGDILIIKPEHVLRDLGEEFNFCYDI